MLTVDVLCQPTLVAARHFQVMHTNEWLYHSEALLTTNCAVLIVGSEQTQNYGGAAAFACCHCKLQ